MADMECPRCHIKLVPQQVNGIEHKACTQCKGEWIADAEMSEILEHMGIEGDEPLGSIKPVVGTMPCPECKEPMANELSYGKSKKVEVDICPKHGVWFDANELQPILEQVMLNASSRHVRDNVPPPSPANLPWFVVKLVGHMFKFEKPRPERSRGQRTQRPPST
jgi:Zn-finger nucleic acid-binding protein